MLLLCATAVLVMPGAAGPRSRLRARNASAADPAPERPARWLPPLAGLACGAAMAVLAGGATGAVLGLAVGVSSFVAARRVLTGSRAGAPVEPLALAGAWDLMAACLTAGLPLAPAVRAAAEALPGAAGTAVRRTAELLAMGSDGEQAWQPALECPDTARFARAARRSGRSGAALSTALTVLATEARAGVREQSEARAQRAGVLITGPLGLCFLPAFLTLGVVPVVIGLADRLVTQW